jgi:hypothetical protein
MKEQEKAWEEWIKGETGQRCLDIPVTSEEYLKNRLWHAFNDGYAAAERSAQGKEVNDV